MRIKLDKENLKIIPESSYDRAYIETILNLKNDGDYIKLKRVNEILPSKNILYIKTAV